MNRVAVPSTSASSGPSCTTVPSLGRVRSRCVPSALSIGTRFVPASSTSRRGTASAAAPLQDLHPQTHPMAPSASTFDTTPVSLILDTASATRAVPSTQTILLSDRAKKKLRGLTSKREGGAILRVEVQSGGCSGFSYKFTVEDRPLTEEDILIEEEGARVVVDDVSLPLINGATLDWDEKLIGSKFQMLANPHSAGECGCKYSFTPKD